LRILIKYKPDVVVGFGGYTAGIVTLLAALMRSKTIIHEQNVIPGRTNKFLDRFADKVAISFYETKKYFKNKNVIFTGNPLRKESLEQCRAYAVDKFGLNREKFTVLIMGGSQGASSLNDLVSKSLNILPYEKKEQLQVIHITGPMDLQRFRDYYERNNITAKVFGFIEKINEAYSACDLAISRSGAAAIFELAAFAKPMILIPYPHPKNNQRFNAIFFAEKNAALYRNEATLSEDELEDLITQLMDNEFMRKTLSGNAKKLSVVNGAEKLRGLVC